MQKTVIREDRNANKQVRSQHQTYAHKKIEIPFCHFPGRRSKNGPPLWGNLLGGVLLLRLTHGEDEKLEDVDVRLEHHNMALNGAASNDKTPYNIKKKNTKMRE
jgi:hypothetical protein